jgi:isochorismate hydrolase
MLKSNPANVGLVRHLTALGVRVTSHQPGFYLKSDYFTPSTIKQKSVDLLEQLKENLRDHRAPFTLGRSALLVLDMQRYFLEPGSHAYIPSAPAIVPGICQLIQAYRDRNLPIVLTRHLNTPEDAGAMARWWRELIDADNPLSEIDPEIQRSAFSDQRSANSNQQCLLPAPLFTCLLVNFRALFPEPGTFPGAGRSPRNAGAEIKNNRSAILIQKSQYDAFYRTRLEDILREMNVAQVVICGVMTHLCCETTARSAFARGFDVFFTVDATATYNEKFHLATLLNLSHGFAAPVLAADILAAVAKYTSRRISGKTLDEPKEPAGGVIDPRGRS